MRFTQTAGGWGSSQGVRVWVLELSAVVVSDTTRFKRKH